MQLGTPTFFLSPPMNPHWAGYSALMQGDGVFADSAMALIMLKTKLSALIKFTGKNEPMGRVSAFAWRIEYQKRGLSHAHILVWTFLDAQDIHDVNQ
jgi:hypothetical protein